MGKWKSFCSMRPYAARTDVLKSIRVHLSPGSSCGLVHILAQRYIFFTGHTAIF